MKSQPQPEIPHTNYPALLPYADFQSLVENNIAGIWQLSGGADPKTLYMNHAMRQILEVEDCVDVVGMTYDQFCSPRSIAIVRERRAARQLSRKPDYYELEVTSAIGTPKVVRVSPTDQYDSDSKWVSTIVTIVDVTVERQLLHQLSESEFRYRALVESNIVGMWQMDSEGRSIFMNQAMADLLEANSIEEALAVNVNLLLSDGQKLKRLKEIDKRVKGISSSYELELMTLKHSKRTVLISAAPVLNEEGTWKSTIATLTDLTSLRSTEREKIKNHAMFEALIASMPEGVLIENRDNEVIALNKSILDTFGFKSHPADDLGASTKGGEEMVAGLTDEPEHFIRLIREFREARQLRIDQEITFRDGRSFEIHYVPISTMEHEFVGHMWKYQDTTERKRLAVKLRDSEAQYKLLFQQNPYPMWVIDVETLRFLEVNESAVDHYGYTREELMAMTIVDIAGETVGANLRSRGRDGGELVPRYHTRSQHRTKAGVELTVEIDSHAIEFQERSARMVLIRDVTEAVRLDRELSESRANLRALVETTTDQIASFDPELRLVTCNLAFEEAFRRIFKVAPREGMYLGEYVPPAERAGWEASLGRALKGERFVQERAVELKGFSGHIETSFNPIISAGAVLGVTVFSKDITERKQLERELVTAKESAEEMNRLKSSFLANMSHEIRTPLTAIQGFASLINENAADEETREFSERILKSGQRLLVTINGILDLASIEANRTLWHAKVVDICLEVQNVAKLLEPLIVDKGLQLEFEGCDDPLPVTLDAQAFGQIVTNLLSNAIKYTPQGTITIKVEHNQVTGEAAVSIRDTGIGIAPDYLPFLFDEFTQESRGFARRFEGTGLGLSITRRLTELMGGRISVASEQGVGSNFVVRFPAAVGQPEAKPKESVQAVVKTQMRISELLTGKNVLLVEDNPETASLTTLMLGKGVALGHASDSTTALLKAAKKNYDLILMDIGLGEGLSGLDVTRVLRQIPQYENTPILALTAYAMHSDEEDAYQAGCSGYLSKPYTKEQLRTLIEEAFHHPV